MHMASLSSLMQFVCTEFNTIQDLIQLCFVRRHKTVIPFHILKSDSYLWVSQFHNHAQYLKIETSGGPLDNQTWQADCSVGQSAVVWVRKPFFFSNDTKRVWTEDTHSPCFHTRQMNISSFLFKAKKCGTYWLIIIVFIFTIITIKPDNSVTRGFLCSEKKTFSQVNQNLYLIKSISVLQTISLF